MKNGIAILGNSMSSVFTISQISLEGWNNISSIICVVLTVIGLILTITSKVIELYRDAKKDGKIDLSETKEIIDTINEGVQEIKEEVKDGKQNH